MGNPDGASVKSYPCGKGSQGIWLSESIPKTVNNQDVVFKIELEEVNRIKKIEIRWQFLPKQVKIEYSSDNYLYDIGKMWYRLAGTEVTNVLDTQIFSRMIFAKQIKITMKGIDSRT